MINSNKLVYGIGVKGMEYPTSDVGKHRKEYATWKSMLFRCTEKYWQKMPTYNGVSCSENFKSYTFFYEWCQTQVGFGNKDENGKSWHLDKDLLVKGNKHYSGDTCVFVPQRINSLLVKAKACRGEFPIGTSWDATNKVFKSVCNNGRKGKSKNLGCFNTPQEAFLAYKTYKEALIKEVANEYKEMLDSRVYEALMNYEVNEND